MEKKQPESCRTLDEMENAAIEAVRTGKAVWVDGKTMWFTSGQFCIVSYQAIDELLTTNQR